jgi:membrane protease YdiL (CAAX protease family)
MQYTPNGLPPSSHGIKFRGIVTNTALGAAIGLALMSAIVNILRVSGHYVIERENLEFSPFLPLILYLLVAVFEETLFRGYIFVTLEQKWGSFVALTTTSLLFGLLHLVDTVPGISFSQHLRASVFIGLEAGVLLNAAFMLTRSLWLGIGIHWAWNFFEGPFYGTNVSGMSDNSSLYAAHTIGRSLFTGGAFGPENGIVCLIICSLAGFLMLRLAIRAGQWRKNPEIEAERL